MKEIEHFMQILNDWVQETNNDLESYVPTQNDEFEFKRASRQHSSQMLAFAEEQIQANVQAQMRAQQLAKEQADKLKKKQQEENDKLASQLESLEQDYDLLAGLEELDK